MKHKTAQLSLDDRQFHVTDSQQIDKLNSDLHDQNHFQAFKSDPKSFVAKYGVSIDDKTHNDLKKALASSQKLADVQPTMAAIVDGSQATVAAIAKGAFAWSSTKIAVAF